jgi:ADP-heptose:LPS heptosyltransferase
MSLEGIEDVVRAAAGAEIDLVVGSWNVGLARAIPGIARVEALDAAWLARESGGLGMRGLLGRARSWRDRHFDLAINFEPDIRSNLLLAASGATTTAGFSSGGGGSLLDISLPYDPRTHTSDNSRQLAAAIFGVSPRTASAHLALPPEARQRAASALAGARRPLVGVHASGGRAIKQWDPGRFGEVAGRLARDRRATIVLTGSTADRPLVDAVRRVVPADSVIDVAGELDVLSLAALLEQLDVFLTGDTGPMHIAAAVGTPVVAVFGPSDPARYAPADPIHRVVRIDLPCAPCNRIRLPPDRCTGHTPDCLQGVDTDTVYRAAAAALEERRRSGTRSA